MEDLERQVLSRVNALEEGKGAPKNETEERVKIESALTSLHQRISELEKGRNPRPGSGLRGGPGQPAPPPCPEHPGPAASFLVTLRTSSGHPAAPLRGSLGSSGSRLVAGSRTPLDLAPRGPRGLPLGAAGGPSRSPPQPRRGLPLWLHGSLSGATPAQPVPRPPRPPSSSA